MEPAIAKTPIESGATRMIRGGEFVRILDPKARTIELSFSSDVELERSPGTFEVLSHAPGACDLSRLLNGAPLLFNHCLDEVIGVVESAKIGTDGKGRAVVRFSKSDDGEEAWQDVQDGILRNVSVGYRINAVQLSETREDGSDVYVVSQWQPYEISIVSVPADNSVGIGRALNSTNDFITPTPTLIMETPIETPVVPAAPSAQVISETRALGEISERDRTRAIIAAGRQYDQADLAQKALEDGRSIDQFRTLLLEAVDAKNKSIAQSNAPIGMSDSEARGFSFVKLFRALSAAPEDRRRFNEAARMELEACQAAADAMTHRSARGTVIPTEVLLSGTRADSYMATAASTGYTSGANAIQTQLLSSSFIDLLRNKSIIMGKGTELSGLVGNVDIPKQTGASTAAWIGEDSSTDATPISFGLVSLRPRTVTNRGEITRRLLMQNSVGVEALFRADLAKTLALEIDRAALYGSGTSNQPTGIKNVSGIGTKTWAAANAPTFAELVALETLLANANADQGSMSYIASPAFRGYAKSAAKFTTPNIYGTIWEDGNNVNGYATDVSNQVTAGDVFFGNWSDLLIGMWGGLDITVDPYTHSDTGRIRVTQFQDVDFQVRRAASFAYGKNV